MRNACTSRRGNSIKIVFMSFQKGLDMQEHKQEINSCLLIKMAQNLSGSLSPLNVNDQQHGI